MGVNGVELKFRLHGMDVLVEVAPTCLKYLKVKKIRIKNQVRSL